MLRRQKKFERGALPGLALHRDRSTVRRDKRFHDCKAQPLALRFTARSLTFLEYLAEEIRRNARAVVANAAFHSVSFGKFGGLDGNFPAGRVLDCVRDKILDYALQEAGVG